MTESLKGDGDSGSSGEFLYEEEEVRQCLHTFANNVLVMERNLLL